MNSIALELWRGATVVEVFVGAATAAVESEVIVPALIVTGGVYIDRVNSISITRLINRIGSY